MGSYRAPVWLARVETRGWGMYVREGPRSLSFFRSLDDQ